MHSGIKIGNVLVLHLSHFVAIVGVTKKPRSHDKKYIRRHIASVMTKRKFHPVYNLHICIYPFAYTLYVIAFTSSNLLPGADFAYMQILLPMSNREKW
jgi:hypothetical protein